MLIRCTADQCLVAMIVEGWRGRPVGCEIADPKDGGRNSAELKLRSGQDCQM